MHGKWLGQMPHRCPTIDSSPLRRPSTAGWCAQDILPPDVPIISVSKGLEVGTGKMMSELIPDALGRRQPAAFLSGPSFAKEVMDLRPTGVVAASKVKDTLHA